MEKGSFYEFPLGLERVRLFFYRGNPAFSDLMPLELSLFGLHSVPLSGFGQAGLTLLTHMTWGSRRHVLC